MEVVQIDRLPVKFEPGFDCRRDRAHCPHCEKVPGDHGVYGGGYWYGVAATFGDQRVALVLEILGIAYPPTVPRPLLDVIRRPRGAVLALHRERAAGARCDWLEGRLCNSEVGGFLRADELYAAHGLITEDPTVDLTVQSEDFWRALGEQLLAWAPEVEERA